MPSGNDSDGENMKLRVLRNILRRLRLRIRTQSEPEGQPVLIAQETIDDLFAKHLDNQADLEECLDALIQERISEIEELNESLHSKN